VGRLWLVRLSTPEFVIDVTNVAFVNSIVWAGSQIKRDLHHIRTPTHPAFGGPDTPI
jgi:hypothetical protein